MDLASGYSDSFNYGNGYTPLANNAIANNNADYLRNQLAMQQAGQYNPFAQSGGFGAMTNYYSGLGRDYTTATGGNIFGNSSGGGGGGQSVFETGAPAYNPYDPGNGLKPSPLLGTSGWGGIGSDARQSPSQYQNPAVDWTSVFNTYTQPALSRAPQVEPYNPGSNSQAPTGGWGGAPANPNMQALLGYTPQQLYSGGGIGSDAVRDPYQEWLQNSAASQGYKTYGGGQPTQIDPFWQSLRDYTGMGQPGQQQPAWNPWGNTGQIGVTDPMGYGTGGYQGNAIPQQNQNRAPVQGGTDIGPFWQGMRDYFGADPKDQSRLPQGGETYPGATNPNYQPGGMTPQRPYESWLNAS